MTSSKVKMNTHFIDIVLDWFANAQLSTEWVCKNDAYSLL